MRRIIKLLTITTIVILLLGTIGLVWVKHFVSTNWKNYYADSEIKEFVNQVEGSNSLPTNIYEAYELVNPNHLNKQISDMENSVVWWLITGDDEQLMNGKQCNCVNAAEQFENRFPTNYHSFSWLFLGHALEQGTSELKCFDFISSNYLASLSNEYFNKPLNELTFEESAELVIFSEHPTRFSNNPKLLTDRLTQAMNKQTDHNRVDGREP